MSLFTEHLVQGLLGAAPDTNGDGYLDLREVYDYERDRLRETSKQVPHCRFDGDGAVNLAKVRAAPAAARAVSEKRLRFAEPTCALAENTVFDDTRSGLPLMLVGFGLVAVSAAVPSNARRATRRRSAPTAEGSGDKTPQNGPAHPDRH